MKSRNDSALPAFETSQLTFFEPVLEDAYALADLALADPGFARATLQDCHEPLDASCTAIFRMIEERRSQSGAWWIAFEKGTMRLVGIVGFNRAKGATTEISAAALGKGYAREAIDAVHALRESAALSDERECFHPHQNLNSKWSWLRTGKPVCRSQ